MLVRDAAAPAVQIDPGEVVRAACENARALARICDVLDVGPGRHELVTSDELPDGAFILPEEV